MISTILHRTLYGGMLFIASAAAFIITVAILTVIPDTWMKWNIFGADTRVPVFIRFVGCVRSIVGENLLFETVNGKAFYADEKFIANLSPAGCNDVIPKHVRVKESGVEFPPHQSDGLKASAKPVYAARWAGDITGD